MAGQLVVDYRPPHPSLGPWVSHYYFLARGGNTGPKVTIQKMYPSDRAGLIFQLAGPVDILSTDGLWKAHPLAFAKGHIEKPFLARFHGSYRLLCVSFKPGMACHFLRDSQSLINGRFVPLEAIFGHSGSELFERVQHQPDLDRMGPLLDEFFMQRVPSLKSLESSYYHAVKCVSLSNGTLPVNKLAEICGGTPRSLERAFQAALGMTPKYFSETVRFRALLRRLRAHPSERTAATAQECGYFDQAHQIREFRRFTGTRTRQFWSDAETIEAAATDLRSLSADAGEQTLSTYYAGESHL
jgi:AraC-like DNA-binding protein